MNIYKYPQKSEWDDLAKRATLQATDIEQIVHDILQNVKLNGDKALCEYAKKLDGVDLKESELSIDIASLDTLDEKVPSELREAMQIAKANIEAFHKTQIHEMPKVENTPGVVCWQKMVPIEKVGLYIPGGTAPLFSTILMLGIPAKLAGCKEIILCTPPNKEGSINPYILYAAKLVGIKKVYKTGGAQAIGAMAYGTNTIPKVYKIFGPGNQFVTKAKQIVSLETVAIDMPAGPSEVLVMCDDSAKAEFVAADLLSQCEHGKDSQCILLTTSEQLIDEVKVTLQKQAELLKRTELVKSSLSNSRMILLRSENEMIEFSNLYAPEHLIIQTKNYSDTAQKITNAGSVFLGNYSPESAGDYASGTNHTLPTNGYAKNYSGVNIDSFVKKITFQELSKEGLNNLGKTVEDMAYYEQLDAHKYAVEVRLKNN